MRHIISDYMVKNNKMFRGWIWIHILGTFNSFRKSSRRAIQIKGKFSEARNYHQAQLYEHHYFINFLEGLISMLRKRTHYSIT